MTPPALSNAQYCDRVIVASPLSPFVLRRLDWRLTARHPRQFFTKEFEQESIADVGLIVDARGSNDSLSSTRSNASPAPPDGTWAAMPVTNVKCPPAVVPPLVSSGMSIVLPELMHTYYAEVACGIEQGLDFSADTAGLLSEIVGAPSVGCDLNAVE